MFDPGGYTRRLRGCLFLGGHALRIGRNRLDASMVAQA